ncbi:ABC transporter ATP-binding protein [Rhizobium rhizogenes]|jgi:lipopolysaccharide transport system ATP-binding protein|uniref:ABC transporter ATP-binding protein n=1 Tax=Rhizobium rhizogenes TaxID=359 RepID=UPI00115E6767|nr:ABC transporter ATP-binding protein [Rhizobium rhizogenes]NTF63397.1 ABC transporter ATP-binding protein [Rhizobium rhizogenes]NTF95293.1 ABC transporter ATP-binding protein [Rhizobium rhizogenes]NTG94729.1 ABC transporter ATP-binding protein [Rhizobium rhizogenes]NTH20463.1 ABC transporter ATP-binding protein [Rhizobium rhizogenes]NTH27100.1 ABC transporter ATP-binding protein [Rhizobium rhizogenes]
MTSISLQNVTVDFPIYNARGRSLKNRVMNIATGGSINSEGHGAVVVRGLDAINLELKRHDRIGLIGHNGSGKTTLLRVLTGVYIPTSGKVDIQGKCTSLINISLGIDPEATGRQNIFLRGALLGFRKDEMRTRLEEIEEFSELGGFLEMPVRTYSSGMQLRLAFSISTILQPEILIMDEWLATGDEGFKVKANQRLNELVEKTQILVIASHAKELLEKNCNRIIWLEHGKVRMDGPPSDVLSGYFGVDTP